MAKFDLSLQTPLMNAAGVLGYVPPAHALINWELFGAFVTNPISLSRRKPAGRSGLISFPGGIVLHTGYPNPGLDLALRLYRNAWSHAPLPMIVHLIPRDAGELAMMIPALETCDNLAGLEVGIAPDVSLKAAAELLQAALSELPIILRLPQDRALELVNILEPFLKDGRIAALSLGPARGLLPLPEGGFLRGRIYGPAALPGALVAVRALSQSSLPVIGSGGLYRRQDVEAMLEAGAAAVQLDTILWRGGID